MFDIRFEINGRTVRPERIADELERSMCEAIAKEIKQKVGSLRDPTTGQPPQITVKGRSLEDLSIDVQGSEELIELVRRRLD